MSNKVNIDVEVIKKMANDIKANRIDSEVNHYHENVELDVKELVSDGYEVFMECKGENTNERDFSRAKGFDMEMIFRDFESFVKHCVGKISSEMNIRLTYYGFGTDRPVCVVFAFSQNEKKAIKLLGVDSFSLMLARTMFQEMVNRIIHTAKSIVKSNAQKK